MAKGPWLPAADFKLKNSLQLVLFNLLKLQMGTPGPEREGAHSTQFTELGLEARVPDAFLCPLAAKKRPQSGLSSAHVEFVVVVI